MLPSSSFILSGGKASSDVSARAGTGTRERRDTGSDLGVLKELVEMHGARFFAGFSTIAGLAV